MDIILLLVILACTFLAGILITILVQWYFLNMYVMKMPYIGPPNQPSYEPFKLPEGFKENLQDLFGNSDEIIAVNSVLQFLFQECRNTDKVQFWFRQRLSFELEELLTRTTTGKMFESIALRDLDLGSQFPTIRTVSVKELSIDSSTGLINDLEIGLHLDYKGGFQLSIDAAMRLSKTAHVSVKVDQLTGLGLLKFTRNPYTHWSFCFYYDPILQLSVESQFQGRSLPQVNNIIASQIRKSLKRKHTHPYYKIRYKPFFPKNDPTFLDESANCFPVGGFLDITVIEVTRITATAGQVYCSLAVDATAWVEMVNTQLGSFLTIDTSISKVSANHIGVNFKQEFIPDKYQVGIVVDTILDSGSNDLRVGDILVAVEGKRINSLSHVTKCIKQSAGDKVSLRVERRIKIVSSQSAVDDKVSGDLFIGLRQRRGSGDKTGDKTDSDSSNSTSLSESPARRSLHGSPEHKTKLGRLSMSFDSDLTDANTKLQLLNTKEHPYSNAITFNETLRFFVNPEHKYLNLSVWSKGDRNTLLGHISLPLGSQCCTQTPGHRIKLYSLLPPDPHLVNTMNHPLSSHPGFEPCLSFGDILLAIQYIPSAGDCAVSSPSPQIPAHVTLSSPQITVPTVQHDFVRTHFTKVTLCGFCFKKIWLKDAFQCGGCMMTCHKKCVSKCQSSTSCAQTQSTSERRPSVNPEIITTSADEPDPIANEEIQGQQQHHHQQQQQHNTGRRLSSLLASVANKGLKRVGSATNLAPPGSHGSSGSGGENNSVSMPPSPLHSPAPSRKVNLNCNDDGSSRSDSIDASLKINSKDNSCAISSAASVSCSEDF